MITWSHDAGIPCTAAHWHAGKLLLWRVSTGESLGLFNSVNGFDFRSCRVLLLTVPSLGLGLVCNSEAEWLPGLNKPAGYPSTTQSRMCWYMLVNPLLWGCEQGSRSLRSFLLGKEFWDSLGYKRPRFQQKHMLLLLQGFHNCDSGWLFLPLERRMGSKFPLGILKAIPSRTLGPH